MIIIFFFFSFSDHEKNSHGVPGLYFKYDVAALKVIVRQDRDNMVKFLVRLCSIIAGIIVISGNFDLHLLINSTKYLKCLKIQFSGIINRFVQSIIDLFVNSVVPHHQLDNKPLLPPKRDTFLTNKLLSNANSIPDNITIGLAVK